MLFWERLKITLKNLFFMAIVASAIFLLSYASTTYVIIGKTLNVVTVTGLFVVFLIILWSYVEWQFVEPYKKRNGKK